jgi:hypothetical protein
LDKDHEDEITKIKRMENYNLFPTTFTIGRIDLFTIAHFDLITKNTCQGRGGSLPKLQIISMKNKTTPC